MYPDMPTPTPFWILPEADGVQMDITHIIDIQADPMILADSYVNGYNFMATSDTWTGFMWLVVVFVVIGGVLSIIKHWEKV